MLAYAVFAANGIVLGSVTAFIWLACRRYYNTRLLSEIFHLFLLELLLLFAIVLFFVPGGVAMSVTSIPFQVVSAAESGLFHQSLTTTNELLAGHATTLFSVLVIWGGIGGMLLADKCYPKSVQGEDVV